MSNLKEIRQKINKIIDDSEKEILKGIRDEEGKILSLKDIVWGKERYKRLIELENDKNN